MEKCTSTPTIVGNRNEATIGRVTFRLGRRSKVEEQLGITVVTFKRIVVQGKELKTIEFITETAKALDAAGIGHNFYSNPAKALKAITEVIVIVARRTLALSHDTPLKRTHKGRIHISPSLLKLR